MGSCKGTGGTKKRPNKPGSRRAKAEQAESEKAVVPVDWMDKFFRFRRARQ